MEMEFKICESTWTLMRIGTKMDTQEAGEQWTDRFKSQEFESGIEYVLLNVQVKHGENTNFYKCDREGKKWTSTQTQD